jgi:hypothetical protein
MTKNIICGSLLLISSVCFGQRAIDRNQQHKRVRMDVSTTAPSSAHLSSGEARSTNADLEKTERQAVRDESRAAERVKMHSPFSERHSDRRARTDEPAYGFRPASAQLKTNVGRRGAAGRKGIHRGWISGR